jgi:hypothetical protein
VGAELFHADVQTDMMKLLVAFRNFANSCNIAHNLGFVSWLSFGCVSTNFWHGGRKSRHRHVSKTNCM